MDLPSASRFWIIPPTRVAPTGTCAATGALPIAAAYSLNATVVPTTQFLDYLTLFPADLTNRGTLNIVARLLARNELPQTGPVTINPGDRYHVRLTVDERIALSIRRFEQRSHPRPA